MVNLRKNWKEAIDREIQMAYSARRVGNEGKARVCARRACGHAITWYLHCHPHLQWESDALRQLQHLRDDESFPSDIREAARRLTAKVADNFQYASTTDPLEDAQIIIRHIEHVIDDDV